jgi:Dam-replacing HTH domain
MHTESQLGDLASRYVAAWRSQNPAAVAQFFAPNASLTIDGGASHLHLPAPDFSGPTDPPNLRGAAELDPKNRHVDEKIRQQLQELGKLDVSKFVKPGFYELFLR